MRRRYFLAPSLCGALPTEEGVINSSSESCVAVDLSFLPLGDTGMTTFMENRPLGSRTAATPLSPKNPEVEGKEGGKGSGTQAPHWHVITLFILTTTHGCP
ncbi:uncharacterized protein VTP21DRAFT_7254 [Calcarisporiella thermophila]|uniref:uncharacterized protein n=1 Tax=Calcarisporiella thermophila TaxID=911321 RepID=UPI0037436B24